jgi:hypothetical protein
VLSSTSFIPSYSPAKKKSSKKKPNHQYPFPHPAIHAHGAKKKTQACVHRITKKKHTKRIEHKSQNKHLNKKIIKKKTNHQYPQSA